MCPNHPLGVGVCRSGLLKWRDVWRQTCLEAAEEVVGQAFQPVMNTVSAKWRFEKEQVWQTGMSAPRGRCQFFSRPQRRLLPDPSLSRVTLDQQPPAASAWRTNTLFNALAVGSCR
jgi:hypothetical protein